MDPPVTQEQFSAFLSRFDRFERRFDRLEQKVEHIDTNGVTKSDGFQVTFLVQTAYGAAIVGTGIVLKAVGLF